VDARSILDLQHLRPSFLDDVSAAEARGTACGSRHARGHAGARARRGARVISHGMSRNYVLGYGLEYPVDDPDEDEDDDEDGDDEDEDDEDEDEEEVETWQVFDLRLFR